MARLTVLDADIIVGFFDANDRHHTAARVIVAGADELAASVLTVGEAGVHAAKAGRLDELHSGLQAIGLRLVELDGRAAGTLSRFRAQARLKMPDICVLHAASVLGADAIGTRDQKLSQVARSQGYETP